MADFPDGVLQTNSTIQADTTGLALDKHIYNSADGLSLYDHLKQVRQQLDNYVAVWAKDQHIYNATDNLSIYDHLKEIRNKIDALFANLYTQLIDADESANQSVILDTEGRGNVVSIYANATTATTFTVEVSNDNTNWVNVYTSPVAENTYSNALPDAFKGFRYVKLSSAAAGTSGTDKVTLIISAK